MKIAALVLLLAVGAFAQKVEIEADQSVDFTKFKTFVIRNGRLNSKTLRDPSTRSLVWRAIAREERGDASKIEGKLDDMVRKSIDKYPPKAK